MKSVSSSNVIRFSLLCSMIYLSTLLTSCVSVNIGPKAGERSKGVEYNTPPAPYATLKSTPADAAWQNGTNGNSISYFSTCNDSTDASLEAVAHDLFAGMTDVKVIHENEPMYNGRGALDTEVEGKVDGVPTRVAAMVFKKDGCTYTLTHVGLPKSFEGDRATFNAFLKSFHAP